LSVKASLQSPARKAGLLFPWQLRKTPYFLTFEVLILKIYL